MSFDSYQKWVNMPIGENPYLSVVIPALNEEARITTTIRKVSTYISTLGFPWEMLVVDGGSKDGTVKAVKNLKFANLKLIEEPIRGKGAGVRRGALEARGRYVLFIDADNATPIEGMKGLLTLVTGQGENNVDIAVGWRTGLAIEESSRPLLGRLLRKGFRWGLHNLYKIQVNDPLCGFKLFTRRAARELYQAQTLTGFSFDLEILYLAHKWGYKVAQISVGWVSTLAAKSSTDRTLLSGAWDLLMISINDWRKQYERKPSA